MQFLWYPTGIQGNDTRLGSVGDIAFALDSFAISDSDLVVVAGDTLFLKDFDFSEFLSMSKKNPDAVIVTCYEAEESAVTKSGILELDSRSMVCSFLEKPSLEDTRYN